MLLPQNAPDAIRNVAHMVDEIWYHVGDTSTDVSNCFIYTWWNRLKNLKILKQISHI